MDPLADYRPRVEERLAAAPIINLTKTSSIHTSNRKSRVLELVGALFQKCLMVRNHLKSNNRSLGKELSFVTINWGSKYPQLLTSNNRTQICRMPLSTWRSRYPNNNPNRFCTSNNNITQSNSWVHEINKWVKTNNWSIIKIISEIGGTPWIMTQDWSKTKVH